MAVLTPVQIVRTGVLYDESAFAAATVDGDSIVANPRVFVAIHNAAVGSKVVTFITPGTVEGYAIADQAVTVAPSTTQFVGPFTAVFTDTTKHVSFTYDDHTSVSVAAFSI